MQAKMLQRRMIQNRKRIKMLLTQFMQVELTNKLHLKLKRIERFYKQNMKLVNKRNRQIKNLKIITKSRQRKLNKTNNLNQIKNLKIDQLKVKND